MNKTMIILGCMSIGFTQAQTGTGRDHAQHTGAEKRVGINTEKPVATLEIKKVTDVPASQVQGFLLPHLDQDERNAMERDALVNGVMIFNTTKNCIDWWDGAQWQCTNGSQKDDHGATGPVPTPEPTPIKLPNTITIENGYRYIASIFDTDYLPFRTPTSVASWNNTAPIAADGAADETIDVQGKITTTGLNVLLNVKATGPGTLPAFKTYINIPAERTEDGQARVLEFSWESLAFDTSTTTIMATIKSLDGDLNVKKLDLEGGLGSNYTGLELGTFAIPQTAEDGNIPANYKGNFVLRAISGIPDKNFHKQTSISPLGSTELAYQHQFVYIPYNTPSGTTWLNNNLGALYADVNSIYFDPVKKAANDNDYKTFGSRFQWMRDSNGHELVDYSQVINGLQQLPDSYWEGPYSDACPLGFSYPGMLSQDEITDLKNLATNVINLPNVEKELSGYVNIDAGTLEEEKYYWVNDGKVPTINRVFPWNYRTTALCIDCRYGELQGGTDIRHAIPVRCVRQ